MPSVWQTMLLFPPINHFSTVCQGRPLVTSAGTPNPVRQVRDIHADFDNDEEFLNIDTIQNAKQTAGTNATIMMLNGNNEQLAVSCKLDTGAEAIVMRALSMIRCVFRARCAHVKRSCVVLVTAWCSHLASLQLIVWTSFM